MNRLVSADMQDGEIPIVRALSCAENPFPVPDGSSACSRCTALANNSTFCTKVDWWAKKIRTVQCLTELAAGEMRSELHTFSQLQEEARSILKIPKHHQNKAATLLVERFLLLPRKLMSEDCFFLKLAVSHLQAHFRYIFNCLRQARRP